VLDGPPRLPRLATATDAHLLLRKQGHARRLAAEREQLAGSRAHAAALMRAYAAHGSDAPTLADFSRALEVSALSPQSTDPSHVMHALDIEARRAVPARFAPDGGSNARGSADARAEREERTRTIRACRQRTLIEPTGRRRMAQQSMILPRLAPAGTSARGHALLRELYADSGHSI